MPPKQIILTDVVVSQATANRMFLEGWRFERNIMSGMQSFIKYLYVNPDPIEVYEKPHRNCEQVAIRLETNLIFRSTSMTFGWTKGGAIEESSRLGGILSSYLLSTFERLGYYSYERDVEKRTLDDYPMAKDYISRRCEEFYEIQVPEVEIIVAPRPLWDTFYFDKSCDAEYLIMDKIVAVPDLKWRSKNFEECLIVHEFTHAIQHKKGWILGIGEMELTSYEISKLADAVLEGRPLHLVARDLEKDVRLIQRAKAMIERGFETRTNYFGSPLEIHAFSEQFRFLSIDRGIPIEKIIKAMEIRSLEHGVPLPSREKAIIQGMIEDSDRKIAESINDQEALSNGYFSDSSGIETKLKDDDQKTP